MPCGKKKTAENVHRARNRVTRPEIAETMGQLEERYRSWKKDTAYLKDIGAYDFKDQTMVSILMDFVPDEVHKEISMMHETAGKEASSLKTIQLMTEEVIQREKDRAESSNQVRSPLWPMDSKETAPISSSMNCSFGTTTPTQGMEALWLPQ